MLAAEKKKKYTVEDYMLLDEGAPFQLINYDLVMSPSPLLIHQLIVGELHTLLKVFLKATQNKGIVVLSPMDVRLDEGNIFQPDLCFIAADRINELAKERIVGAPDLIIEILSPSNAYYDLRQKKNIYEKYGVKEYIIIDPIDQNADVYTLTNGGFILSQTAQKSEILKSLLLPGFHINLLKLFNQQNL